MEAEAAARYDMSRLTICQYHNRRREHAEHFQVLAQCRDFRLGSIGKSCVVDLDANIVSTIRESSALRFA